MKRSALVSLVLGSLLLSACGQAQPPATGEGASSSAVVSAASDARVIRVEATDWTFTPSTITAKVGEKVKLELVGVSGDHGIGVPALNLDVKFKAGETVTVDLPTDKAGVYPFRCNVMCGDGHFDMLGSIVIE